MVLANKINLQMKNIILILIFSFTNIYAQSNKFCNLYLPQCKNESLLEEFYSCEGNFTLNLNTEKQEMLFWKSKVMVLLKY